MKRRIAAFALSILILCTCVSAAGFENFARSKTYAGQFSDVSASSTFYDNVAALYEYGLSVGKTDGTFGVQDPVSVSQVIIFAGRLRSLYETGDAEAGARAFQADGQSVCAPYLRYLQSLRVIGTEFDQTLYASATRAQVAHILAGTLPAGALSAVNETLVDDAYAAGQFISDVTASTPYAEDILDLYRWGISIGSDSSGSYYPSSHISRGALAAMLTRIVDPALRVSPHWDLSTIYSARGRTYGSLIFGDPPYIAAPKNEEALAESVAYMLKSGSNVLQLEYGTALSATQARQIMNEALKEVKSYCEQGYNRVNCSYDANSGSVKLAFSTTGCTLAESSAYRNATLEAAIAVHDQLWFSGQITSHMSDYAKAKVYYNWIVQNCEYDYQADDLSLSHIPYSLFALGKAVCDGYTGAYNLLLKLEGIECCALSNKNHIWTVARLDGTEYHIDTTWGDVGNLPNYDYFAMTEAESRAYHAW